MKFGVMDAVLGTKTDADAFARAKRIGCDGIEINLSIKHLRDASDPRAAELQQLTQQHALPIPSTVLGEHNSGGLATWWRGRDADEEVRLALDFTARVGARVLLVPFFFNEPKGKTHRDAVAERLKPLAAHADKIGVELAFEGVNRAEHLVEMARQIASPAFGVYFDMANVTWCELDAPNEIRTLGTLVKQSHAKEAKTFTGDARLGAGKVDHAGCATAFKSVGYDKWLVLETPSGTDQEIAGDLATARRFYGQ
jgi:sugar phosphate isomerase/epimerase